MYGVLKIAAEYIESIRPALEAGCRGVLRFKAFTYRGHRNVPDLTLYILLDKDDKQAVDDSDDRMSFRSKSGAEQFAKSLKRTAEFVGDDDNDE